tara:strand:- start:189 stop:1481 length:1293 start_codon:yes stop_codon:yes gene_type:complete
MATLAETLRQVGYVSPQGQVTGPNAPLAKQLRNYATNVIPTAKQNISQLRSDIDAGLTMGDQGIQIGDRQAFERQMAQVPNLMGSFLPSTPLKVNPLVGTRYEREFLGGLAEKQPQSIENLKGSSLMVMPWDASSRNYAVKSISGEALPKSVITHGGQDYARDIAHMQEGIAGASNLGIAKRIQSRDAQARKENLAAGGTGDIIHSPITMGEGDMNFSVMPTETMLGIIDAREPSKKFIKELDASIRQYKDPQKGTTPFKDFAGVNTEEGRMQLFTGEGVTGTAGDLRKTFINRTAGLKGRQEYLGFNAEDLAAALRDPALEGVPKGYIGNTLIKVGPEGMHLRPSKNPTYSTDFTGQYIGTLGKNVPIEVLFPKLFSQYEQAYAKQRGDLRNMAIGGLEKSSKNVSELIDQQVIDNYYKYLENQSKLGL